MKIPRKYICPQCHEKSGVNIVYGMPGEELREAAKRGEVALGGCCIEEDAPERQCLNCNHQWLIKRRGIQLL